ncbi:hypothetical protein [Rhodanobacter hydrolyticus]|uniref:Uncharacterized protein n=1 Tax=Rhodanobacter hydrolyticus TaxID=2250595 RepID=A0ABW8J264_9GAMM
MSIDDTEELSNHEREHDCQPLQTWSKRLSIPPASLLHHASQGHLTLFTIPQFCKASYFSIHEDLIREGQENSSPLGSGEAINQSIYVGPRDEIYGLILSAEDCSQLAKTGNADVASFDAVFRKHFGMVRRDDPTPGRLGNPLRPEGWRIVGYREGEGGEPADPSHSLLITEHLNWKNVYARDADIAAFFDRLNSWQFIEEFCVDGGITEDVPAFISTKLDRMIDVNRNLWRDHAKLDDNEKTKRRQYVEKLLRETFEEVQDKKKAGNPRTLAKLAASICDRTNASLTTDWKHYVTPRLLTLITTAKIFWSAPHVNLEDPLSHPDRSDVEAFLRKAGFQGKGEASAATTLIRPEGAANATGATKRPKHQLRLKDGSLWQFTE